MTSHDLAALRKSLDDIDAVLVSALGERARLAREIAQVKAAGEGPVRDTDRETALLQHRSQFGERLGLDPAFVRRIFREILDDSVRRQQDALNATEGDAQQEIRVGFQGTEGAYGHQAALQHFAVAQRPVAFKAYASFRQMLEAVLEGHVERAMLPIENTTAGSVYESYDLLLRFNLSLVGEEIVDVRHCLLGVADVPIASMRRIHSHPQALSQCSEFLSSLTDCEGVSAANTALAAQHVKTLGNPHEAAIASEEAGAHFGLHVLRRDIANQPVNYTRFVVVAATPAECDPRIAAKVSMVLSTRHEHGALVRCLNVIADEGLNVTKLESRPRPGTPWEYVFYIDVEGHIASPRMQAALAGLAERTVFLKVLGCYPARELPR
ncbi:MAG TPA: bifunctional chorismate mutase/prephenate dehydratase [Vicinamibacterales bacterium]|nr:bifunctional chorismate mutase/prephenate dehydratase [Vicinamibacterales bacterium]